MKLEIKHLSKHFGGIQAIDDLHFQVKENSITGLIGPNGAGKTTAFNLISHFLSHDRGEIFFDGKNLGKIQTHEIVRKKKFARTFQQIRLFGELTVRENLILAASTKYDSWWKSFVLTDESAEMEKILKALSSIHLENKIDELAKNLSYGQSKLIEIIRTILTDTDLILLDEPAAGVNPTMLLTVEKIIRKLKKQGKTVLIIEHNIPFLMGISDEVIVMDRGKFLVQDTPENIQKNDEVLAAYLGK